MYNNIIEELTAMKETYNDIFEAIKQAQEKNVQITEVDYLDNANEEC